MRLVVKVGTSTLSHHTGNINIMRVEKLCRTLSDIKNAGYEVLLVSSGAIGMGVGKLPLTERPKDMATKQAAAAVGQCELMYRYNDTLSAIVAVNVRADLLVILTDIDGLYDSDPRRNPDAKLIREVHAITPDILAKAGGAGTSRGTGGMATKLTAARICMDSGIPVVIANGRDPLCLYDIMEGKSVGTRFVPPEMR